jgi:formate-dependent phosphoribosylglycinamide formyltransferase (GAR transformylase)
MDQGLFGLEMVVDGRQVRFRRRRDCPQGGGGNAVFCEQPLGGIKDSSFSVNWIHTFA